MIKKQFVFVVMLTAAIHGILDRAPCRADDSVLAGLVNEALTKNNEIKAMDASVQGLQDKSVSEGSLPDPRIGFTIANLPLDSFSFKKEAMTQKQVSLAQTFPWPGKRGLKSRTTELESAIMELKLKARKLALARAVTGYYYDLGITARSLAFNRETAGSIEQLIQAARTRYASGKGSRQDILMAQIELDKLISDRIDLESRYRMTENMINGILNRSGYMPIPPPKVPALQELKDESGSWVEKALSDNPGLGALRLELKQNQAGKALSEKGPYPDVTVQLTYGQRDDDPMGNSRSDFVSLGASLPIPVWKHSRQDMDVAFQEASMQSAAYRLQDLQARIPQDVERLAVDLNAMAGRHDVYTSRLIPSARDLAGSARSDYEVGKAGFGPMINAQINALSMELAADKLVFEVAKKRAELNELLGNLTDFIQGQIP